MPQLEVSKESALPAPVKPAVPERSAHRMIQLDFLRGVAILLVIGNHNVAFGLARSLGIFVVPMMLWGRGGWTGVDLFFVLSGFLIGGLLFTELLKTHRLDVGRFMVRRGFKIWPSYYVFLIALGIWYCLHDHFTPSHAFVAMIPNLLHVQNYWSEHAHQTWSLAIEEHFYLVLPFAIVLLCRRAGTNRPVGVALVAGAVMAFCLMDRILIGWNQPYDVRIHYNPTHIRIDSLFFGVMLAYMYHYKPAWIRSIARFRWLLLICGLLLIVPEFLFPLEEKRFVWTFGYTTLYLGFGAILLSLICCARTEDRWSWFFETKFACMVAWIGTYSYSIYLWHVFIVLLLDDLFVHTASIPALGRAALISLLLVLGSILIGVVLGRLVEIPALALRDRWFPRRAAALEGSGPATSS